MITLIGEAPDSPKYQKGTMKEFWDWLDEQKIYQLDTETDITESWINKQLITIQFGSDGGGTQWVIQWSALTDVEKQLMRWHLESKDTIKLIHNSMFEAIVLLSYGIILESVYDTMLVEQVLDAGRTKVGTKDVFGLKDLVYKYLGDPGMSKEVRTSFGDNVLTEDKVVYAAGDVIPLGAIRRMQMPLLTQLDLDWVAALENEAVLAYAEMTFNGLNFDQEKWRANIALAQPVIDGAKIKLDQYLTVEPFYTKAKSLGYISDIDRVEIKWTSPQQRGKVLKLFFPDIPGASVGVVKKYLKDHKDHVDKNLLDDFMKKDYTILEQRAIQEYRQDLIDQSLMIPAGRIDINWNSVDQVLPLVRLVHPSAQSMDEKTMGRVIHPIAKDIATYKDNLKLTGTYGESFIEQYVDVDGKIRTTINQIVSTGRASSKKPNLQNIPVENVGARYRECFIASPGCKIVGADMSSQELVIIATLSKELVWLSALENGEDLHSVCAEVVYGPKWKAAAESTCEYYHQNHQKCHCKEHEKLRYKVKRINYGLAYGMTEIKLSAELSITRDEAKLLMRQYFKAFPKIKKLLDALGRFGVEHGYSRTMAPFYRRRYYPVMEHMQEYIEGHVKGVEFNSLLGEVERAAKNAPIQGSAGDQIKLSSVMIRRYIHDNNLQDKIKPVLQIHDENVFDVVDELAEMWKEKSAELMAEAAKVSIKSGLLKADASISDRWTK